MREGSMTPDQRQAAENLQAVPPTGTDADRLNFMRAIVSVSREELASAPQPPKEKRGRKPAPKKVGDEKH
jgi:hypothetical protein